jgi:hypothetical protein
LSAIESQAVVADNAQGTIFVKKASKIQSPKDQVEAFRKAARELGCDESEERFQEALRTVAKQKPEPSAKKEKRD